MQKTIDFILKSIAVGWRHELSGERDLFRLYIKMSLSTITVTLAKEGIDIADIDYTLSPEDFGSDDLVSRLMLETFYRVGLLATDTSLVSKKQAAAMLLIMRDLLSGIPIDPGVTEQHRVNTTYGNP